MTTFRELYWSEDPIGLQDLDGVARERRLADLCIADPDDEILPEDASERRPEHVIVRQRRIESVRAIYGERLSADEWGAIKQAFDNRCAYCGLHTVCLFRDHVIPILLGGRDYWRNVVPSCRRCNSSKHTKLLDDWLAVHPDQTRVRERYEAGVARRNSMLGGVDAAS